MAGSPLARLGEELRKLQEFLTLLEKEQELLTRADTEGLITLVDIKTRLANELSVYSREREDALQALHLPNGRAGVQAWLDRSGTPAERREWQALLDMAARLRFLNETNGKLIALHMQKNQQAFTALMAATDRTMTYGPDGQQQTGLGGRILGTA